MSCMSLFPLEFPSVIVFSVVLDPVAPAADHADHVFPRYDLRVTLEFFQCTPKKIPTLLASLGCLLSHQSYTCLIHYTWFRQP